MSQLPGAGRIQIRLDGLMIGEFLEDEKGKPICEVSVLDNVPDHQFTICYETQKEGETDLIATNVQIPHDGVHWELGIEGAEPDAAPFITDHPPDRLNPPTNVSDQKDFRWSLNVEDEKQFPEHPDRVPVKTDHLRPIIRFNNGLFFSGRLTKPLAQMQNGANQPPFGVASDEMGVDLNPDPGREVVLKNIDTGRDIFRIPVKENERVIIFINNVPVEGPVTSNVFHFHMYYLQTRFGALDVPPEKQYDFKLQGVVDPGPMPHHLGHDDPHDAQAHGLSGGNETDSNAGDSSKGGTPTRSQPAAKSVSGCGSGGSGGFPAPLCGLVFKGTP